MASFDIRDDTGKYGNVGDYIRIKAPVEYKPILATTSTPDSDRTQDLVMHNTPMGTIVGYNMVWGDMSTEDMRMILDLMVNKSSFNIHHFDIFRGWSYDDFYASNFNVEGVRLRQYRLNNHLYNEESWKGLSINIRAIYPYTVNVNQGEVQRHLTLTQDYLENRFDIGQYGAGNIDLLNRPRFVNPDGSISTVRSMSFNEDGKEILVPTVAYDSHGNPTILTDEQAIDRYHTTGEYLGKFNTVAECDDYADRLHRQQEVIYI